MIEVSDKCRSILNGRSFKYLVRAQSWLEGRLLSDEVPISAASETSTRANNVPEYVTFTVPGKMRGFDWSPTTDDHPLSSNGQELRVQLGIDLGPDGVEWIQRGVFRIQEAEDDGNGAVDVTATGLLAIVQESRFPTPYKPTGTMASTIRGLVEPGLSVAFTGLVDRSVPAGINYDQDRLTALNEVLDAWAAESVVTPDGYLLVFANSTPTEPVLSLTHEVGGTIIKAVGSSTREDGYNVVIASGSKADGTEVVGRANVLTGPQRYGGPWSPLPVTFEYSSPLLTTVAQCTAAATSIRNRKQRSVGRQFVITCVPDPTIELGDPVAVTTEHVTDLLCTVEAMTLPYVPGEMVLTVREVS